MEEQNLTAQSQPKPRRRGRKPRSQPQAPAPLQAPAPQSAATVPAGTPLNKPYPPGPKLNPGKIPPSVEPELVNHHTVTAMPQNITSTPQNITQIIDQPEPATFAEPKIDLRSALMPFARIPHDPLKKPEEVIYRITRNSMTVEITNAHLIAAKKAVGLI